MSDLHASSPCGSPCGDALDVLAHGHEQTRALADECRRFARHVSRECDIQQLAETLCRAIRNLAALEEELFYPEARRALAASSVVELAMLEHATARQIIRQMQLSDPREARYQALVLALADCVERHALHEQSQLFPQLRQSCMDLAGLGERMSVRQQELEVAH